MAGQGKARPLRAGLLLLLLPMLASGARTHPKASASSIFAAQAGGGTVQQALDPAPADGARSVDPAAVVLQWAPGRDAISHRLFFGRTDPPPFREEMKRLQYEPGPLAQGASYLWRVDELTPSGIVIGRTWRFTTAGIANPSAEASLMWWQCLDQAPTWYATPEAVRIAENVLLYQRRTGGWPKNIEMSVRLTSNGRARVAAEKTLTDSTIDNDATTTQIRFLARVLEAAKRDGLRTGVLAGVHFLLDAQYRNGGWPQYYPLRDDYSRHITFNDDAIIHVMELLRDIADGRAPFAWIEQPIRAEAARAVNMGIKVILATQIRTQSALTAWCAQHDAETLLPCAARSYELPSISGRESIGIIRFLMAIAKPSPDVVRAIESAVSWFRASAIQGWRLDRTSDPSKPHGFDYVLVADPAAPPLWARFYDIRTNRPMFVGRDGILKTQLSEVEYERRTGYTYLGQFAAGLLQTDYPAWRKRLGRAP